MAPLIERPRVERSLREAVAHAALTLLHAPAGSGKSSAAALAFAQQPGTVWMDARPWHHGAFIRAIVEAVQGARPQFGRLTLGALDAGASAAHAGHLFAGELSHVREPLYLIVDNAHVFHEDERFLKFVDVAVSELPEQVHILALGRSLPDAPLVRSFARGRVTILDAGLLLIDADELRAFARAYGRELNEDSLERVMDSTEGWAAGVALTLSTPNAVLPLTARQMLAGVKKADREFLEYVCIFETLDAELLERQPHFAAARERIESLRREGVLLPQRDERTFRVHPLLRDMLLARLRARKAESTAHRIAAECYLNAGNVAAACYHADAAGDAQTAAAVLRTCADAAFAAGDHDQLRSLADRIESGGPDRDVRFYTAGLFEKAAAAPGARETFVHAAEAAASTGDDALLFTARAQVVEHDIGRLRLPAEGETEVLRERAHHLGIGAQARAAMLHGWAMAVRHDFPGALSALASLPALEDPTARFNVDILRAYALTALGQAEEAQTLLDALVEYLEDRGSAVLQALTLIWFARLALLWGNTTIAADAATAAQRLTETLTLRSEQAALLAALAEIATHHGEVTAAVRYAERARAGSARAWYAADVERIHAFAGIALARAAFLGHDNAIARDLALHAAADAATPAVQRACALSEAAIYTLLCEPAASAAVIVQAREAIANARPVDAADAAALATADGVIAFLDAANGRQREPLLRGCEPFEGLLQRRRGLVTLELAGIAVGNARRGSSEGAVAFETAMQTIERDGPRFEARLARAYAATFIPSKDPAASAAPGPDLTAREREILELLVDGLSNKEIAQRLVLSPRTVETHVERVLGKLEVGSRSRAIAKAIRLGLVALELP